MKALFSMVLFSLFSFTASADAVCAQIEGPSSDTVFEFEGSDAYVNDQRMRCGSIPVSRDTTREFPEGSYAIAFTCGPNGGGIYSKGPFPVEVYAQGCMSEYTVFYARLEGNLYRCE